MAGASSKYGTENWKEKSTHQYKFLSYIMRI